MAITISGENNNDRILASDGVIDSLSGFNVVGVITATSFTGDLTGDVTGNLTGNVTGNINNTTLLLQTGGTERLRITSGGIIEVQDSVTLSSNAPSVKGKIRISGVSDATTAGGIEFHTSSGGGAGYGSRITSDASGNMHFLTRSNNHAWSERLRITSGGDILTGGLTSRSFENDSTNQFILEVTGSGSVGTYGMINVSGNSNSSTPTGRINFVNRENSVSTSVSNAGSKVLGYIDVYAETSDSNAGDDSGGYMRFATKPESGGSAERLRITSDGRLLVGGTGNTESDIRLYLHNPSAAGSQIQITGNGSGTGNNDGLRIGYNGSGGQMWLFENQYLRFATNNNERLRILSDGTISYRTGGGKGFEFNSSGSSASVAANVFAPASYTLAFGTNGNERLRIDSIGRILYGFTSNFTGAKLQLNLGAGGSAINIFAASNDANAATLDLFKSRGTTPNNYTALQDGDFIGELRFKGTTGSSYVNGAVIQAKVNGTTGSGNDLPTDLIFRLQPDGSGNTGEVFRITSSGKVLVGDGNSVSPSRNLDVRGSGHQQILLGSTNNAGASLMVDGHGGGDGSGGNYCTFEAASDGNLKIRNYDPAKSIIFGVGSNTGSNDSVVISSDGYLWVNRTSSSDKGRFEVQGFTAADIQVSDISAKTIATFSGSTPGTTAAGKGAGIVIKPIRDRGCNYFLGVANSSANQEAHGRFIIRSGNFYNQSVERFRITEEGYVRVYERLELPNGETYMQEGAGNSVRIVTNNGYVDIGAQNSSFCHINTDRAKFYLNTATDVNGHLTPYGGGVHDLGGNTSAWRNIYGGTLTLSSYAVVGSLVVNDPGSSYYSFNNRMQGNTIIKGTTVCTSNIHTTAPNTFPASNVQLMVYNSTNGQPISNTNCARLLIATDARQTGAQGYHGSLDFGSSDCSAANGASEFQYRVAAIMCRGDGDTSPSIGDGDLQFYTKQSSGSLTHRFDIAPDGTLTGTDTNGIGSLSDQRLKTNIQDYTYDLNKFKQLKTRTFDWINPEFHQEGNQRGFVAQEVETVDPYWNYQFEVSKETAKKDYDLLSDDENYNIRDHRPGKASKLNGKDAMYVSVIQQLISKIETLEVEVAALKGS